MRCQPRSGVFESAARQVGLLRSMKKTIVYILATDYAGSHYLSLMLGSHSRAMHLGEVKRLLRPLNKQGTICNACRDKGPCPILSGIGPHNIDSIYGIIFSRVPPRIDVLIDNSKMVRGWTDRFLGNDTYTRKYIHLIRDPRALVRRWMLEKPKWKSLQRQLRRRFQLIGDEPAAALQTLLADKIHVLTRIWLLQNRAISGFLAENKLDTCLVTYHDLARQPAAELERVCRWIGLEYEPTQIEYWNFEHHGTQKTLYEWNLERKTAFIDLRWKEFFAPETQQRIISDPPITAYLDSLALHVVEDGLTRHEQHSPAA
jgi:hypothetical protein